MARSGPGPIAARLPRGALRPGGTRRGIEAFPSWQRRAWRCFWAGLELTGGGPWGDDCWRYCCRVLTSGRVRLSAGVLQLVAGDPSGARRLISSLLWVCLPLGVWWNV
ncbi:hypothetical protein NDU88_002998 [Pleurodeles waltl]|uniref:Uncharacterized protein n=1 Tax=Pleurodeles waltl TaxID=8319 RepID=A0AAV7WMU8_PLEWA|nr:hypothetical protein NDU88_002998 [Pleurodeles waltl]